MTRVDDSHMDEMALAGALAALKVAYPRQEFPEATVRLYATMLDDLDGQMVAQAVKRIIRRSKFLPTVAEIREDVAEATLHLPTEPEAWQLACSRAPRHELPAPLLETIEAVGGRWTILHSDRAEVVRAQFRDDYNGRRRKAVMVAQGADPVGYDEALALDRPPRQHVPPMLALEETARIVPRPVYRHLLAAMSGCPSTMGEDELRADAIDVLRENDSGDMIHRHAQRILDEASA